MKKQPQDVTLADLGTLATKDLLAVYNHHADEPIARFADHMSGFRRTKLLLELKIANGTMPKAAAAKTPKAKKAKPSEGKKASCNVLVSKGSNSDQTEYHSVAAAFKALKLPMEKHQRFRREVKLNGKATFDQFTFTSAKK